MAAKKTAKASGTTKTAAEWLAELVHDDDDTQEAAKRGVMKASPAVRKEIAALIGKALKKGADAVSHLWALAAMIQDDAVLETILGYVKKGNDEEREVALGTLTALTKKPPKVEAAILAALEDKNDDIVAEAASVCASFAKADAIAPLVKALAKVQKNPRWGAGVSASYIFEALTAIARRGKAADVEAVVDVLTQNLTPKEKHAALSAFRGLIELGKKAKSAVPKLEEAAKHADPYVSSLARHALGAITGDFKPHLSALEAALKSKDLAAKSVAKSALAAAGKD